VERRGWQLTKSASKNRPRLTTKLEVLKFSESGVASRESLDALGLTSAPTLVVLRVAIGCLSHGATSDIVYGRPCIFPKPFGARCKSVVTLTVMRHPTN